jgi:hypothetical protein
MAARVAIFLDHEIALAAAYAPTSKYKVCWSLILAAPDEHHG